MEYLFGVDVGGSSVKIGMFSTEGMLLDMSRIPTDRTKDGRNILPDIHKELKRMAENAGRNMRNAGIGIGVPGPVRKDGWTDGCWNLGWKRMDLLSAVKEQFQLPSAVCNDANAATLGEAWYGAAEGYDDVMMVTLGTGTGGGILRDGEILWGSHGCGGEWGHMQIRMEEKETCVCGRHGCLNQYASTEGLMRIAVRKTACGKDAGRQIWTEPVDVWRAAENGNKTAMEVMDEFADILGRALAAAASIFDPQIFVIGGGLAEAGEALLERVRNSYRSHVYSPCVDTAIVKAKLGNNAGIWGAAKLILDKGEEQ